MLPLIIVGWLAEDEALAPPLDEEDELDGAV